MSSPRSWPASLAKLAGVLLVLSVLIWPSVASAHSLDQFLQSSYVTVAPHSVSVELDLTPGVLVAPQVLREIDTDSNKQISAAETRAYAAHVLGGLLLRLDGQERPLSVTQVEMPAYLALQAGYGLIRIFTTAALPGPLQGTQHLFYSNTYHPTAAVYQVNAFVASGAALALGSPQRDARQHSLTIAVTAGSAGVTAAPTSTIRVRTPAALGATASAQLRQLATYVQASTLSPWTLALALALAALLGAFHALTPGHGKTLIAAYLVGSRGTTRHAAALGGIVTLTHTASVIVIGLLALVASQLIVPGVLVPGLEVCSGLLVVVLGVRLFWTRWSSLRSGHAHDHAQGHPHSHGLNAHTHDHGDDHDHPHSHTHDHHGHTHAALPETFRWGTLLALGVSGGLVPCPEALGIMVIAVGLNRVLLGFGLIVAFSGGLAAVLIGLGILLVRFRPLVERLERLSTGGQRLHRALPVVSAAIVALLGGGIVATGLAAYF